MADAFVVKGIVQVDAAQATTALQNFMKAAGTLTDAADKLASGIGKVTPRLQQVDQAARSTSQGLGQMLQAFAANRLVTQLEGVAVGLFTATDRMQAFRGTLRAVTGSVTEANSYLQKFADFANKTPFDLPEVVQAGVKFKAMGLEIERNLKLAGTLAATFGTDLTTAVDAVSKTLTGSAEGAEMLRNRFAFSRQEMERYGVVLDKTGQVILRGTNDIKQMQRALEAFASAKGGDALAIRAESVGTAVSNLKGKVFELAAALGEKLAPALVYLTDKLSAVVDWMKDWDPNVQAAVGATVLITGALAALAGAAAPLVITLTGLAKAATAVKAAGVAAAEGTAAVEGGATAAGVAVGSMSTALAVFSGAAVVGATLVALKSLYDHWDDLKKSIERASAAQDQYNADHDQAGKATQDLANRIWTVPGGEQGVGDRAKLLNGVPLQDRRGGASLQSLDKLFGADAREQFAANNPQAAEPTLRLLEELGRRAVTQARTPEQKTIAASIIGDARDVRDQFNREFPNILAEGQAASEKLVEAMDKQIKQLRSKKNPDREFVGPVREQRSITAIQLDAEEVEHLEKIGKLTRDQAIARRKELTEELKQNDDRKNARALLYKLEEQGFQDEQRQHNARMNNLKAERAALEARGQLTPEAEIGLLGRERKEVNRARNAGIILPDEAKKQNDEINIAYEKANRERLDRNRDTAAKLVAIEKGTTDGRMAELKKLDVEMERAGVAEVDRAKIIAKEKIKIWVEEAQAHLDSEAKVSAQLAQAEQRRRDTEIKVLEDRKSRGEGVEKELAQARSVRAEAEAKQRERQGQLEVQRLEKQRKLYAPGSQEYKDITSEIGSARTGAAADAAGIRDDAKLENEKAAREELDRRRAEGVKRLELQRSALGLQEDRLKSGVAAGSPAAARMLLDNVTRQYELEMKILEAEKARAEATATAAEKANLEAEYAQKSYKAKQDAVQALRDANKLIDDQKNKEKQDRAEKTGGDFTMGGVYGSYAEAVAADKGGSDDSYGAYLKKRAAEREQEADKKARLRLGLPSNGSISGPAFDPKLNPGGVDPRTGGTPPFVPWNGGTARLSGVESNADLSGFRNPKLHPAANDTIGSGASGSAGTATVVLKVEYPDGKTQETSVKAPVDPYANASTGSPTAPLGGRSR